MDCHMMVSEPEKAWHFFCILTTTHSLVLHSGLTTLPMREARYIVFTLKQHVRKRESRITARPLTLLHTADPLSLISSIHGRKMRAGVAISPDTPASAITDEIGNAADMLLVMTVYPGSFRVQASNKLGSYVFGRSRGAKISRTLCSQSC
jgi:pentose-5-phosphate-3-epimerase